MTTNKLHWTKITHPWFTYYTAELLSKKGFTIAKFEVENVRKFSFSYPYRICINGGYDCNAKTLNAAKRYCQEFANNIK